jgi:transcriptional regulator with PAS, ATPase and Fis domain
VGLFEPAHGGTLFLDEIADMSMGMQVKLLRVLQEGEVRPIGSNKRVKIEVRLVTASNRDLNQMVTQGKFRQDLFFRINGLTIKLPPLRERKDDIPLLVKYLVEKIARNFNLQASDLSDEAMQVLLRHPWPGNIRELEGVIRNALLFAKGRLITPEFISIPETGVSPVMPSFTDGTRKVSSASVEEQSSERQMILDALRRHELDKDAAAKDLGITLRSLYTRLERHGIPKKKTVLMKYLGMK